MLNRIPLEVNKRPVRIQKITIQETLQVWVTWNEENLFGILWTHARLKYGKLYIWWNLEITRGLSPQKINQLSTGLKCRAYYAGLDADTFNVFPTKKEGIYFCWLATVNKELMEKRKRQRRKRHSLSQNTEGCPFSPPAVAPLPIVDNFTPPSLPLWARPRKS